MRSPFGLSYFWDVFLPLGMAGVPAALFVLMGWLIGGADPPGGEPPAWIMVTFLSLQTLGMVAMAVVALVRYGLGRQKLQTMFPDGPSQWRMLCLFLGVCCLTLFDILVNIGAAFGGMGQVAVMLVVMAVPFYLTYLLLIRMSLWRVPQPGHSSSSHTG